MRILRHAVWILSAWAASIGGSAWAEIPDLSPSELERAASHIFSGKLARIYTAVVRDAQWETIHSIGEVQVTRVEKGKFAGRLVYVRFWRRRFKGKGPAPDGAYGHRQVPAVGSVVRVFVTEGEDAGFDVVRPNGFSLISSPPEENRKTGESG